MTDEDDFRRQLRNAPAKPSSPIAGYVVAGALALVGVMSIFVANSRVGFAAGLSIVGAAAVIAWRTRSANQRWGP